MLVTDWVLVRFWSTMIPLDLIHQKCCVCCNITPLFFSAEAFLSSFHMQTCALLSSHRFPRVTSHASQPGRTHTLPMMRDGPHGNSTSPKIPHLRLTHDPLRLGYCRCIYTSLYEVSYRSQVCRRDGGCVMHMKCREWANGPGSKTRTVALSLPSDPHFALLTDISKCKKNDMRADDPSPWKGCAKEDAHFICPPSRASGMKVYPATCSHTPADERAGQLCTTKVGAKSWDSGGPFASICAFSRRIEGEGVEGLVVMFICGGDKT